MSEIERPSQNSARTVLVYDREPAELLDAVERAIGGLSNWSLVEQSESGLRAVRTTSLLRFKDDVSVEVEQGEGPGRASLKLRSASRVGKGDLGQNPRNLRELLGAIDHGLG